MVNLLDRNHIQIKGEGEQVLLFAHGFGCDQRMWHDMEHYFLPHYKLIYFDHVGSGKSNLSAYDSQKYSTLEGYAQDVLEIIEQLELQHIIYVGHSISSMIGLIAANKRPEYFDKMVMIGPSPCYLNDGQYKGGFNKQDIDDLLTMMEMNFSGWANYMAPMAMDDAQPAHSKQLEEIFVSANPHIARQFAEVTFYSDYRDVLHELTVPTLLLQCSEDSIVPMYVGEYLHNHIVNSELVVLDVKGHYPHISQPKITAMAIEQFVVKKAKQLI